MSKGSKDRGNAAKRAKASVWCDCGHLKGGNCCGGCRQTVTHSCDGCGREISSQDTITITTNKALCMRCYAERKENTQ